MRALRWWFGITYLLAGVGSLIAAPIMVALGNWGGIYQLIFGLIIGPVGWKILPWRVERRQTDSHSVLV